MKIYTLKQEGINAENGKVYGIAVLFISAASELVTSTSSFEFTEGSIAWDINTGDCYGLKSSGDWVKQ